MPASMQFAKYITPSVDTINLHPKYKSGPISPNISFGKSAKFEANHLIACVLFGLFFNLNFSICASIYFS